jgi:hypothetical protein
LTIPDYGDDLVTDSDDTNLGECTGEAPAAGSVCTKHTLFEKDAPGHIDGNDSGVLFPHDVTESDIAGLSYGYCVELAGQNNCPTTVITEPTDTDIPLPPSNSDNENNGGGSQTCDPTDPFCEFYVNPEACFEPTIISAIVPEGYYNADMDKRYNWRCIFFADSFITASANRPYLSSTVAIVEAGKIVALEAIASNGSETVTHRFQPNDIDSSSPAAVTTEWIDS